MQLHSNPDRGYENAIEIINSRRRQSRPAQTADNKARTKNGMSSNGTPDLKGTPSITGMREWLRTLGHGSQAINELNVIHIAGTKGKGSTCAFTESILRAHGRRTGFPSKTGMYTSPHLIHPEERVRINSKPLDRSLFAKYFFEVYDKLPQLAEPYNPALDAVERGPRFLQLFALLAFHVFIRENVDVTILETHNGGEYDATNVVEKPVVTAITTLGMDHIEMLGPTIENIAWHKSGIFKPGAIALSTQQESAPAQVLEARARERDAKIRFADLDRRLPMDSHQLQPLVQQTNASLALAAAEVFLKARSPLEAKTLHQEDIDLGVKQWVWPGRFQLLADGPRTWYLDAAHNDMSVKIAADWFARISNLGVGPSTRVLMFSHYNELRDGVALLQSLALALKSTGIEISHVAFTTYAATTADATANPSHDSRAFHAVWKESFPDSRAWDKPTVEDAIELVKSLSQQKPPQMDILVTGSQHLIGPTLQILQGG